MSEEYSVGYSEGYQAGWNAAMDATPTAQPAPVQPMAHIVGEIDHTGKVWKPVQPAPVQGPQRYSPDGEGGMELDSLGAYVKLQDVTTPPAPAVPDALTSADIQEHIEYVAGWNECRQAMLEMMK
jgi:hypothetical protein